MSDKSAVVITKQRLSSQERRAAIIEAALLLFAEKGFRGTTTRELAARVGVSEPILYEHFRTKRDLYTAIIDEKSQEGVQEFTDLLAQFADRSDDRGFFNQLAVGIVAWYEREPQFVRLLMFSGLEGHELKDLFYERHNAHFFRKVSEYIAKRTEAGAMRALNPQVAARAFFGMIAHYCMSSMLFTCARLDVPKETVVSTMVDIFLNGVRAAKESE